MLIDRLEELLAQMAEEDETGGEEREDVPALVDRTIPKAAALVGAEKPLLAGESGGQWEDWQGRDWQEPDRIVPEMSEPEPEEPPHLAQEMDAALAPLRREQTSPALEAAARSSAAAGRELGQTAGREAQRGVEMLYYQTVQASRPAPAPQLQSAEQAGRTLRAEEPGRVAALTVEELDRAVRRDSRRYDGGMTIF